MHPYRTHTNDALRAEDDGATVRLSGWVHAARDVGGILFLVLRDHYGATQLVVEPGSAAHEVARRLRVETTVRIDGVVRARPAGATNKDMATGAIEVVVSDLEVLGGSDVLPFPIVDDPKVAETVRMEYRFLDLRRKALHDNIVLRSKVASRVRQYMSAQGFLEIQTPILTASSPEGARDYLVPSRVHPGTFYALPQAPQMFKQLLMNTGFDRYFQIAPCFRDEDGRADRSPGEFYQIDVEMAFATQEDVFTAVGGLIYDLFTHFSTRAVTPLPFPRLTYKEAIRRFGSDKPDLRFGLELVDVSDAVRGLGAPPLDAALDAGGVVRAIVVPGVADRPRRFFDELDHYVKSMGRHGLMWIARAGEEIKGSAKKWFDAAAITRLQEVAPDFGPGAALLLFAGPEKEASTVGGWVRLKVGDALGLRDPSRFEMCWIVDFPMYERDEDTGQIIFSHNPFSMPQGGMDALVNKDPLDILAWQYDIVCNGVELSSGAIRNHRPDLMVKAFEVAGYTEEDVRKRFGALFRAFHYGPPPHGGIAPGLDRIVMLLAGVESLRDVIAFPMNIKAQDLLMGAPAPVSEAQLRELHLALVKPAGGS
jgi:aspartyl-tRNA synthetase